VGGHDVGLVADQAQHHHSGGELGHFHDRDLAVALPVNFFVLRQVFKVDIFQLFNLTLSVTLLPARRPLMMVELIFSAKVMFLRITLYCYVDI